MMPRADLGFTLVELLVVCAILLVLMGLLVPIVGWASSGAGAVRDERLLRTVHSGLLLYRDARGLLPPTPAACLESNGLAPLLGAASGILDLELAPSDQQGVDIVDGDGVPLLYLAGLPGAAADVYRAAVPLADPPGSDPSDQRHTAYVGFVRDFELASAGADGLVHFQRNDPVNRDNCSVSAPYGALPVH